MSPQRPRILVVDDTPANLMMLANALDEEFSFQLVTSGQAALDMAAKAAPELILLDVMMPGMDGYETCRLFKAEPLLAQIPIIFVTALSDNGAQLRGLELGAADYLHKPINIDIARQRMKNLLERERLRREIEAHRNSLEAVVAARTSELVAARDTAEAANRSKTLFLTNISHELRTPLNIILWTNDQIQRKVGDEVLRKRSEQVRDAARELLRMVDDLLLLARSDDDHDQNHAAGFSPASLIAGLAEEFRPQALAKGLSLTHEIDPSLPAALSGSEPRLRQILKNFLSNALKFSEHGTITTRVILEEARGTQLVVSFEVEDQGIGIPENQLRNIFDSFTQVDDSSTRKYGGLGVGLAINKYLADKIRGLISVESSAGKGSRFWVTVRLGTSAALLAHQAEALAITPLSGVSRESREQALGKLFAELARGDFASIALWEASEPLLAPLLGRNLPDFRRALEQFAFDEAHRLLQAAATNQIPSVLAP